MMLEPLGGNHDEDRSVTKLCLPASYQGKSHFAGCSVFNSTEPCDGRVKV